MAAGATSCIFCPIARSSTSTPLLYTVSPFFLPTSLSNFHYSPWKPFSTPTPIYFCTMPIPKSGKWDEGINEEDEKVVAFPDINPSAFKHYLVIPVEHVSTVKDLRRRGEDYELVSHMLNVGRDLLHRDAPNARQYRFGFHQPPFNSVNHLHLHCLALPFIPSWKHLKYVSLGPLGAFLEAEKLLEKIKPSTTMQL